MTVEEKEQGIKDAVKKIEDVCREQIRLVKDKYKEDLFIQARPASYLGAIGMLREPEDVTFTAAINKNY